MEDFVVNGITKQDKYNELMAQVRFLFENEPDLIARMANVSAMLRDAFGFWWVGFYRVVGSELVLGPFQGPLACMRIAYGRGVCGTAWKKGRTIVVPDVDKFPGHIACSSRSRSEIVVPVCTSSGDIIAVLDIDSEHLANFDDIDAHYLAQLAEGLIRGAHF